MLKGISDFELEETIKQIDGHDLSSNFVVVFPSNRMTKFIDYKKLINQKTGNIRF